MKKEMLINVLQPEECRIAIVEDGTLEELYVERTSQESYVGNIYKGRIVNIEPSIQAAFVDFGIGRNGFLHVSDVDPAYYRHLEFRPPRDDRGRGRGRPEGDRGRRNDRPRRDEPPRDEHRRDESRREEPRREEHRREEPRHEEVRREEPRMPPPPSGDERVFGAGLFDDVTATTTPSFDVTGDAVGEPEAGGEERAGRPRRRRRGRRQRKPDEPPANENSVEPAEPETSGDDSAPPALESVDRRTDEGDDSFEGAFDSGASDNESDDEPIATSSESDEGDDFGGEHDDDEDGEASDEVNGDGPQRRPRGGPHRGGPRRRLGRDGDGRPKPPIQEIFKRGQEVLVQVIKEGIGTKGPTLSTYISIAGRYLVLMPSLNRIGVSRKIADEEARRRLKDIVSELDPPKGVGFIIRTAGVDRNKKELQGDLAYLLRIWQVVVRRVQKQKSPAAIYQESDMITRTIRDTFTNDIDTVWVDERNAFAHAQEFLQGVMPRYANRIKHYDSTEPLFFKYRIEEEILRIQQKKVPLPHGGSIVIEQTEALVAIDVNSGSFRADNNAEETAFQMNLHAAREIARQLRLRDLGGVIINDFIDMRDDKHRRDVEKTLREAVKRDRARTKVLKISQFGIIEMTRQRIRPSLKRSVFQDCPACQGHGHVKTIESMSIDVMRMLQLAAHRDQIARIAVRVHVDVADYLLNRKRGEVHNLEETGKMMVVIEGILGAPPELLELVCYDNHNNEVRLVPAELPPSRGHRHERR